MKTMKKVLVILLALAMVFSLAACGKKSEGEGEPAPKASVKLRFTTGGEAGTYYAFGSVIAQHVTNNTDVTLTGVVGSGSQSNIEKLDAGDAELGFCQSDVMAYAYNGERLFTSAVKSFSVLGALYTEQVQIVTLDPSIKTVADLKGKNVSIGAAGSGVYFNAIDILGVYGLTESDITPTYQSFGDSANSLRDGQIDAAFIVAGAPTNAVTDLSASKQVYLVSIEDNKVEELLKSSPYYAKCVISKDTYNMPEDCTTVGVGAVVLVADSVSEDAVYQITKDIFEDPASLVSSHAKYGEVSLAYGASLTDVPYHPGAAKYFAEKNITVPTK